MAISKENTRVLITIPKTLKKELEEIARIENRSLSNYVLNLIYKDLESKNK
jgi:metal-responsive CopG/Arc/MetJ family transcriptional regulator